MISLLLNLDALLLSGTLNPVDRRVLVGVRSAIKGRFHRWLELLRELTHGDVIKMLLEVPTGIHFTRVEVVFILTSVSY